MNTPSREVSMLIPDFPFPYDEYLAHPDGLGSVPAEQYGTEVAVVGAGMSGLVAAYELMKLGLKPVVYESAQLGGRLRGARQPGTDHPVADLGGMRFRARRGRSSTTSTCSASTPGRSPTRSPRPPTAP